VLLLPWWIYVCIIGILGSGYMAFRTSREEKQIDEEFIEKEGQVYIDRIQQAREKKSKLEENLVDSGMKEDQSAS